jgi:hypothetical protein
MTPLAQSPESAGTEDGGHDHDPTPGSSREDAAPARAASFFRGFAHDLSNSGRKETIRPEIRRAAIEEADMRELFIEELVEVRGGLYGGPGGPSTEACCEEGPFDGCCWWGKPIEDLIKP